MTVNTKLYIHNVRIDFLQSVLIYYLFTLLLYLTYLFRHYLLYIFWFGGQIKKLQAEQLCFILISFFHSKELGKPLEFQCQSFYDTPIIY